MNKSIENNMTAGSETTRQNQEKSEGQSDSSSKSFDLKKLGELLDVNFLPEAKAIFHEYINSSSRAVDVLFSAADLFLKHKLLEDAELAYRAALEMDGSNVAALGRLGDLAQNRGDSKSAVKFFRQIIAIDGMPPDWVYIGLGNALEGNGEIQEAIECFQKVVGNDSNLSELSNRLQGLIKKLEVQRNLSAIKIEDKKISGIDEAKAIASVKPQPEEQSAEVLQKNMVEAMKTYDTDNKDDQTNNKPLDEKILAESGMFDYEFYLRTYPDVATYGGDLARHFLDHGWKEGRDPSEKFCVSFYLTIYPDVVDAGINPVIHYQLFGARENRLPTMGLRIDKTKSENQITSVSILSDFYSKINQCKVVSFDFFDTLVERSVGNPLVVHYLLEQTLINGRGLNYQNLAELRIRAELMARSKVKSEVSLKQIYEELKLLMNLSDEEAEYVKKTELELEIGSMGIRPIANELLKFATALNKKIAITSDFYIGKDFIKKIADKVGLNLVNVEIFVSTDIGFTKHEGGLFEFIAEKMNVKAKDILHVGDNKHSDVFMPTSLGLHSVFCPTTYELLAFESTPAKKIEPSALDFLEGTALKIYSDLVRQDMYLNEEPYKMGALILAPVMYQFSKYVEKIARDLNSDVVLYLSRDMLLPYQIAKKLNHTNPKYMYSSRQCLMGAGVRNYQNILEVLERDFHAHSLKSLLTERFLFEPDDISELITAVHPITKHPFWMEKFGMDMLEEVKDLFLDISPLIYSVSERHAAFYKAYILDLVKGAKKPLIVDIGYRGTTQRILYETFGVKSDGVYFLTWPEINNLKKYGLNSFSFVDSISEIGKHLTQSVSLMELFFSSTEPSVKYCKKVNDKLEFFTKEQELYPYQSEYIEKLHASTLVVVNKLTEVTSSFDYEFTYYGDKLLKNLSNALMNPPKQFRDTFKSMVFEDAFGGASSIIL